MANHSSILVWEIPWTEEPGGLHSMKSQRVGEHSDLSHIVSGGKGDSYSGNFITKTVSSEDTQ